MILDARLDEIWREGDEAAPRLALSLSESERIAAVQLYVSALLDLCPIAVTSTTVTFSNFVATIEEAPRGLISFSDLGTGYDVGGITIRENDGPGSMSGFMVLLEFARDHSDSLLYLPSDERDARISGLAERGGASARFVSAALAGYPRAARAIAA
jgi:hypothetical protein